MPVFKPRNRLVNFRLSEEEFDKLQGGCRVHGARSISDYARSCVLKDLATVTEKNIADRKEETASPAPRESAVVEINNKVNALESRIEDLLRLVNSLHQSSEGQTETKTVDSSQHLG